MRFTLFVLALTLSSALALSVDLKLQFAKFKGEHGITYESQGVEDMRFKTFASNWDLVSKHNMEADAGKHTFRLAMNKFADLTASEFVKIYNGFKPTLRANTARKNKIFVGSEKAAPDSQDWRTQGYVTDVKDQGKCGSCWAFSTTGALEGQHFKTSGSLVSLSEQQLVDCSGKFGNNGCQGGVMDQAFTYIMDNKGIESEETYPYEAINDFCAFDVDKIVATDSGLVDIKSKNETALKEAVGTIGPVSVAIDASKSSFHLYSSGIYDEHLCSETKLDHGVLVVGYGSEGGKDFWIVKNSWAATWGEKGYIRMTRGKHNQCGIATSASYPTI